MKVTILLMIVQTKTQGIRHITAIKIIGNVLYQKAMKTVQVLNGLQQVVLIILILVITWLAAAVRVNV